MSKYDFEGEFNYLEDEMEFEDFLNRQKKKKIIIISIISALILSLTLMIILVQNPYIEQGLTQQNDFENIEIDDYYPEK